MKEISNNPLNFHRGYLHSIPQRPGQLSSNALGKNTETYTFVHSDNYGFVSYTSGTSSPPSSVAGPRDTDNIQNVSRVTLKTWDGMNSSDTSYQARSYPSTPSDTIQPQGEQDSLSKMRKITAEYDAVKEGVMQTFKDSIQENVNSYREKNTHDTEDKGLKQVLSKEVRATLGGAWSNTQKEKIGSTVLKHIDDNVNIDGMYTDLKALMQSEKQQFKPDIEEHRRDNMDGQWNEYAQRQGIPGDNHEIWDEYFSEGGGSIESNFNEDGSESFFDSKVNATIDNVLSKSGNKSKVLGAVLDNPELMKRLTSDNAAVLQPEVFKGMLSGDIPAETMAKIQQKMGNKACPS